MNTSFKLIVLISMLTWCAAAYTPYVLDNLNTRRELTTRGDVFCKDGIKCPKGRTPVLIENLELQKLAGEQADKCNHDNSKPGMFATTIEFKELDRDSDPSDLTIDLYIDQIKSWTHESGDAKTIAQMLLYTATQAGCAQNTCDADQATLTVCYFNAALEEGMPLYAITGTDWAILYRNLLSGGGLTMHPKPSTALGPVEFDYGLFTEASRVVKSIGHQLICNPADVAHPSNVVIGQTMLFGTPLTKEDVESYHSTNTGKDAWATMFNERATKASCVDVPCRVFVCAFDTHTPDNGERIYQTADLNVKTVLVADQVRSSTAFSAKSIALYSVPLCMAIVMAVFCMYNKLYKNKIVQGVDYEELLPTGK